MIKMKKKICIAVISFILMFFGTVASADFISEFKTYPLTQVPVFSFGAYENIGLKYVGYYISDNMISYQYSNIEEYDFHNYRHVLEANGYTMYNSIDNSEYFTHYTPDLYGTTVRYKKDVGYTTEYVTVSYLSSLKQLEVRVSDQNNYTTVICADDDRNAIMRTASLLYICGYYYEARDSFNEFINILPEDQQQEGREFFSELYNDIEYAITYLEPVEQWFEKIEDYHDKGLYYEAMAEIKWLRQTYKLAPQQLGRAYRLENDSQYRLNEYNIDCGLSKAEQYCSQGLYYEAIDELNWIRPLPFYDDVDVNKFNYLIGIINEGLSNL